MYKEIAVALDGSLIAAHAAAYAATIPSERYRLVHVEPPFQRLNTSTLKNFRLDWHAVVEAEVREELIAQTEEIFGENGSEDDRVTIDVRFGDIVEEIIAASTDGDLLVMTTRGRGAAGRALFGSVSDQVSRRGIRPTLLLRPDHEIVQPRRVVVPLDGSATSEHAIPVATRFAKTMGVPIVLVQIVASPGTPKETSGRSGRPDPVAKAIDTATVYLAKHAHALTEAGHRAVYRVILGEPAPATIGFTRPDDVIVVSTRAHTGLTRLLLGSFAESLVREAPAPVLLVHEHVLYQDDPRVAAKAEATPT